MARVGLDFSSLLSSHEYSPWKGAIQWQRSALKIWGSDKNTRSGSDLFTKSFREKMFLLRPSRFQVREVILIVVTDDVTGGGQTGTNVGVSAPTL